MYGTSYEWVGELKAFDWVLFLIYHYVKFRLANFNKRMLWVTLWVGSILTEYPWPSTRTIPASGGLGQYLSNDVLHWGFFERVEAEALSWLEIELFSPETFPPVRPSVLQTMEGSCIFQSEPFLVPSQLIVFDATSSRFDLEDLLSSSDSLHFFDVIPLRDYYLQFSGDKKDEEKLFARYTEIRSSILESFLKR